MSEGVSTPLVIGVLTAAALWSKAMLKRSAWGQPPLQCVVRFTGGFLIWPPGGVLPDPVLAPRFSLCRASKERFVLVPSREGRGDPAPASAAPSLEVERDGNGRRLDQAGVREMLLDPEPKGWCSPRL